MTEIDLVAGEVPITFGDTKEGSFGIRINDAIREMKTERVDGRQRNVQGAGKLENADGKVGERTVGDSYQPGATTRVRLMAT